MKLIFAFIFIFLSDAIFAQDEEFNNAGELLNGLLRLTLSSNTAGARRRTKRFTDEYEETAEETRDAAYFLIEQQKNFKPREGKDTVIIIGPPDSGKTTLLNYLTPEFSNSISGQNSQQMTSTNKNRVSLYSSFIPESVIDKNDKVYYKIPSLVVTKNASTDISAAYFTKKVFDNARSVKVILTFPYSKIVSQNESSKPEIISLFKYTANLLTKIQKFKGSIALAVSLTDEDLENIPRNETSSNDSILNVYDEVKLSLIEYYLSSIKSNNETYFVDHYFRRSRKNAVELLDTLSIIDENSQYNYVSLFKIPSTKEPSKIDSEFIETSKKEIVDMVENKLKYLEIRESDSRYYVYGEDNGKYWYKYFSAFMEAGSVLKMVFVFFKLVP